MDDLIIPKDVERWPEFRALEARLGKPIASHALLRLWVELGHQAVPTQRVGFLPEEGVSLFGADLQAPDAWPALTTGSSRLLHPENGGWHCARFETLHPHLAPNYEPVHMKGARVSAFVRRQQKEEGSCQTLLLPMEVLKDEHGKHFDPDTVRRLHVLVRTLDNVLGNPTRHPEQFGEGLVQDAARVVAQYQDEELQTICKVILDKRKHPGMPRTAEQLLARWDEIARGALANKL